MRGVGTVQDFEKRGKEFFFLNRDVNKKRPVFLDVGESTQ